MCQISAEETEWKMSSRFRNYEVKVQVGKQDGKEQSKVGMENSLTGGCENCGSQGRKGMGQVLRVEASSGKALFRKGRPEHIYRRLQIY